MNGLCFKRNFAIITFTAGGRMIGDIQSSLFLILFISSFLHSVFVSLISIVCVQVFSSNSCVDAIRSQFEYIFAMSDFLDTYTYPCFITKNMIFMIILGICPHFRPFHGEDSILDVASWIQLMCTYRRSVLTNGGRFCISRIEQALSYLPA